MTSCGWGLAKSASCSENEHAASKYRQTGNGPEGDKTDDLPDDEQRRDIYTDNAPKFDGRKVQRKAISEQ